MPKRKRSKSKSKSRSRSKSPPKSPKASKGSEGSGGAGESSAKKRGRTKPVRKGPPAASTAAAAGAAGEMKVQKHPYNAQYNVPAHLELKPSTIEAAGLGLFAAQDLQKDQIIGQYEGEVLDVKTADQRAEQNYQIFVEAAGKPGFVIDARNSGNYTRFINHACFSDEQNVMFASDGVKVMIIALKPIRAGSELMIHYSRGMNLELCFERYAIMYQTGQMKRSEFMEICAKQGLSEDKCSTLLTQLDAIRSKSK
jgi:hypothetical protein